MLRLNDVNIELTQQLLQKLKKYVQEIGECESGGVLLGGYIPIDHKYIITDATEPCSRDESGPMFFLRNRDNAQKIINQYWADSMGKINYLGEWHTHPCVMPYPSNTDRKLLKTIISDKSNVWNETFILIVGNNNTYYLGMTNTKSKGNIIAEMQIEEETDAFIFD